MAPQPASFTKLCSPNLILSLLSFLLSQSHCGLHSQIVSWPYSCTLYSSPWWEHCNATFGSQADSGFSLALQNSSMTTYQMEPTGLRQEHPGVLTTLRYPSVCQLFLQLLGNQRGQLEQQLEWWSEVQCIARGHQEGQANQSPLLSRRTW